MSEFNAYTPEWPQSIVEIDSIARAKKMPETDVARLWATHDLLAGLFSGRYRGSGRPFISHLAGTAGLALMYGEDLNVILAGYAHAAYTQGEFGTIQSGASAANRKILRAVIGDEAEALVFDYDELDWLSILMQHASGTPLIKSEHKQRLVLIRILNELDDSLDSGVYGVRWCEQCLTRLELGADFVDALSKPVLGMLLRKRIAVLNTSRPLNTLEIRPKKSTTVANPAFAPRLMLRLARKARLLVVKIQDRVSR